MDLETIKHVYVDLFNNVEEQDPNIWLNSISQPLEITFTSKNYVINEDLKVNYLVHTLPKQFYESLINTVERDLMGDIIIENEVLVFNKFKEKATLFDSDCTIKTLMCKWLVAKHGDWIHDRLVKMYDEENNKLVKVELGIILFRLLQDID